METHGWDHAESKRIFTAYCQFLILKKEHADWDDTQLSPCYPVHVMWFRHTQMNDYNFDMRSLLGHVVSYDEADTWELRECLFQRLEATREASKRNFGSHAHDEELWDGITVRIVDTNQFIDFTGINRRMPITQLFQIYANKKEESINKLHFSFDGKTINNVTDTNEKTAPTLLRLGIEHNGEIEVNHVDHVHATVRYSSDKEGTYRMENTKMISRLFDHFATNFLDTERSKLVFFFRKERVYGYESPMALGFKCRDNIIDVVDIESYKCKNCVCCNPLLRRK
mmetsp:Transcript_34938/g.84392  ORF Transcript_34938/g.84392 Transcript_34938/m.84392 type:complete len:283 (+) Transcript_34938:152-1000(+)